MIAVTSATVPLHEIAGGFDLGLPDAGARRFVNRDETMVHQPPAGETSYFPRIRFDGGFKLIHERWMSFGGRHRGTPAASPRPGNNLRVRVKRDSGGEAPRIVRRVTQGTPAGLLPTTPWWENYLTGVNGYLS